MKFRRRHEIIPGEPCIGPLGDGRIGCYYGVVVHGRPPRKFLIWWPAQLRPKSASDWPPIRAQWLRKDLGEIRERARIWAFGLGDMFKFRMWSPGLKKGGRKK